MENTKRKIRAVSTTGQKMQEIESSAKNWEELRTEFAKLGYGLKDSKVMVGESKQELQNGTQKVELEAILPENDFTIFILPARTKSGI